MSCPIVPGACSAMLENSSSGQEQYSGGSSNLHHLTSSTGINSSSSKRNNDLYNRDAWAIFETEAAKEKVLDNLTRVYMEQNTHARSAHSRPSSSAPKIIELDVDCSDSYGRYEIDADGKGGAGGVDGSADAGEEVEAPRISIRRIPVFVSSSMPIESQTATVLSAAVSSKTRIGDDRESAITIARRLDTARDVPHEARLETILDKLFQSLHGNDRQETTKEDMLDVAIAYLRRVHLFTYYNGCVIAANVGSTLTGNHPTSVIHLRLKEADEILRKAKEETADMYDDLLPIASEKNAEGGDASKVDEGEETGGQAVEEPKDMLVMRLDDSIEKALKSLPNDMDATSPFIVNETVDALASEIESKEEKTKREWIENHAVVDEDGRARCSFHFCRKLFKDRSFLRKHLIKKHGEYLTGEMAKCHDSYMMNWWEDEDKRPVPQILVDCGSKFGMNPVSITGGCHPCASDPEPQLWREKQDRMRKQEEDEERYREKKAAAAEYAERTRRHTDHGDNGNRDNPNHQEGGEGDYGGGGNSNFVDVDDMKDEKVELSFNNIKLPSSKKKKKKKKKKLL